MNTTAVAALIPLSTSALASLHVLAAAATAAVVPPALGGGGGGSLPTNTLPSLAYQHHFDTTCYPADPTISTSPYVASHHQQQYHYHHNSQYQQHQHQYFQHGSNNADWLFSINLLYLIAAPLLLRELPAMMATLDPLIDYLFEPSSWLAFPGWCAELWRLFREEKGRITVSRRNSAEALHHRASLEAAAADLPKRSRTW